MTGFQFTVWPSVNSTLNSCLAMPMNEHINVCAPGLRAKVYAPSRSVATVTTPLVR